jgi:hypothetical protein
MNVSEMTNTASTTTYTPLSTSGKRLVRAAGAGALTQAGPEMVLGGCQRRAWEQTWAARSGRAAVQVVGPLRHGRPRRHGRLDRPPRRSGHPDQQRTRVDRRPRPRSHRRRRAGSGRDHQPHPRTRRPAALRPLGGTTLGS